MNYKHLFWIIPITLIIGIVVGNEIYVCHKDTAPNNAHVTNVYDCEEGCINAEWVLYGYQNLTEPKLYTQCAEACRTGDVYFTK